MNRRRITIALASLMLATSLFAMVPAMAAGNGQTCQDLFDDIPILDLLFDHDTCVVCVNNGNNAAVCVCKALDDLDALGIVGAKNLGQCIKALK